MIYLLGDAKVLALAKWLRNRCSQALIKNRTLSIFNVDTDATVFALMSIASYNVVTGDFDDVIVYVILEP